MSIAFLIVAVLTTMVAIWKESLMNKFVTNKESVMITVNKRSLGLAVSVMFTAMLFIPYALVATLKETFICVLGLGPIAFTAMDMFIFAEYHSDVRSLAVSYTALKNLPSYRAKVRANYVEAIVKFMALLILLSTTACGSVEENTNSQVDTDSQIAQAIREYNEVAAKVETFNAYGEINMEIYREDLSTVTGTCSAWKWNGKTYTIQHCNEKVKKDRYSSSNTDYVEEWEGETNFSGDFYTEGLECSPDFRWWGTTTKRWVSIPSEQIFKHTRDYYYPDHSMMLQLNESKWRAIDALQEYKDVIEENANSGKSLKEKARAAFIKFYHQTEIIKKYWTSQQYLCASSTAEDAVKKGDSGGPLLAGDEVIGSGSFFMRTHNTTFDKVYTEALSNYPVSCFAMVNNPTIPSQYVDAISKDFSDIFDDYTDVFNIIEVLTWEDE